MAISDLQLVALIKRVKPLIKIFIVLYVLGLRSQYSLPYSLFINNELTLVLLAFGQSMEFVEGQTRCPSAGFTIKRPKSSHQAIDLAAKLSVLLGWVKVVDWQADKPALYKKIVEQALQKKTDSIQLELDNEFQSTLNQYIQLTKNNSKNFDEVNEQTGLLSEQVALAIGAKTTALPEHAMLIASLFNLCGQLISITDHLIDLESDQLSNQYNPILYNAENQGTSIGQEYLKLHLRFNRLSIQVQDLLAFFQEKSIIQSSFCNALRQALLRMKREVRANRPVGLDQEYNTSDLVMAAADCGLGITGTECDCGDSLNYFDQQVNQCCCRGGHCPCDNCCKGGGGGGCCCDNCCKGGNCPCDNCGKGGGGCHCNGCCKGGGGGGGCCCDNCGKGSGSCCCDNCGNCCSHSGSGGSCCDGSSSGGTQYQPSKDELELLDSINNTINNLPIEDQVIDKLERLKILDQNQLTEITHLVDSVAEVDQEKLERTKEVIDLVERTESRESTKGTITDEQLYRMLKAVLR